MDIAKLCCEKLKKEKAMITMAPWSFGGAVLAASILIGVGLWYSFSFYFQKDMETIRRQSLGMAETNNTLVTLLSGKDKALDDRRLKREVVDLVESLREMADDMRSTQSDWMNIATPVRVTTFNDREKKKFERKYQAKAVAFKTILANRLDGQSINSSSAHFYRDSFSTEMIEGIARDLDGMVQLLHAAD